MLPTDPASETLAVPARHPIDWFDFGERVWARLVCLRCGLKRVHPFGLRHVLGASPYGSSLEIARRRLLGALGASSIEHHRAAREGVSTVAAREACRRMGLSPMPVDAPDDPGPFAVFLCEAETHFHGFPQVRRSDSVIELAVDGHDPNPLATLTQSTRGTRAEGYAEELASRALAWRTWRLVAPVAASGDTA